jgi:hypothetical protein
MLYILVALFFFLDAVAIHILVCRNAKEEGLFLKIFFVIAGVNLALCWMAYYLVLIKYDASNIWFVPLSLTSTVLYLLLIPTYLVFYFSTQQSSPSKKIMLLLLEGEKSFKDLQAFFKDEDMIAPRVRDLLATKCIAQEQGRYSLTFSGVQMAYLYTFYQGILGRKKGG